MAYLRLNPKKYNFFSISGTTHRIAFRYWPIAAGSFIRELFVAAPFRVCPLGVKNPWHTRQELQLVYLA